MELSDTSSKYTIYVRFQYEGLESARYFLLCLGVKVYGIGWRGFGDLVKLIFHKMTEREVKVKHSIITSLASAGKNPGKQSAAIIMSLNDFISYYEITEDFDYVKGCLRIIERDGLIEVNWSTDNPIFWITDIGRKYVAEGGYHSDWKKLKVTNEKEDRRDEILNQIDKLNLINLRIDLPVKIITAIIAITAFVLSLISLIRS